MIGFQTSEKCNAVVHNSVLHCLSLIAESAIDAGQFKSARLSFILRGLFRHVMRVHSLYAVIIFIEILFDVYNLYK